MEKTGIKLDVKYLEKFSMKIEKSIKDLEKQIFDYTGQEFNISSPSQLSVICPDL